MSKDYYKILGVDKSASTDEIKQAYRKLALKYHPDKGGGADSEVRFKEASEAYAVLADATKRQQYDQYGSTFDGNGGAGGFGGFDFSNFNTGDFAGFEDIFESFFGGGSFQGGRSRTRRDITRGKDVEVMLEIGLDEAVFGVEKELHLNLESKCEICDGTGSPSKKLKSCAQCGGTGHVSITRQTMFGAVRQTAVCNECSGSGEVPEEKCKACKGVGKVMKGHKVPLKVPAGIDDGQTIRVAGQGGAGVRGGKAGDLYVVIRVMPSREYRRDGQSLYKNLDVPYTVMALGGTLSVPTLHGDVKLKIPAGTQVGEVFKIKGYGVQGLENKAKGDLFVQVGITIPQRLTLKQRKLLGELNEE